MTASIAASWDIAWRLVWACPELRIYETHPAGGTYDCLTLASPTVRIDINRVGSIHVHYSPGGEAIPLIPAELWIERSRDAGGTQDIADDVLQFCRISSGKHAPCPHGVTYRVIARVLAARQYDSTRWDARSQYEDASGYGGGIRWPVPSVEMSQIPANEVWGILRDGEKPIVWLWDGWMWNQVGERINLFSRFQTHTSTDALAGLVTARGISQGAAIPVVDQRGEQPIGTWPSRSGGGASGPEGRLER